MALRKWWAYQKAAVTTQHSETFVTLGSKVKKLEKLNQVAISWLHFLSVLRAYSNCTGPGFSLHSDIVMPYIANYGTKEQIERFIPQMTAGKCIGAIAMTEPGAGR